MEPGGVRELQLNKGQVALVDAADYEWLSRWKWFVSPQGYALRSRSHAEMADGQPRTVLLHRAIMTPPQGMVVDHIDGKTLNNTRANMRVCTHSQNQANKRTGVRFRGATPTPSGKWAASIRVNYRLICLGTWPTREAAARAYDCAALMFFGEFARLNFPEAA